MWISRNTCVEVCDSRSMHVWWTALWWSWSTILFIDCLPYEWRSGTSDGIFLPIYPPRGMRSSTLLRGLINFCNKYVSSLWLMLSPWIICTLTLPSLLASLVSRNFRRYHKPTIYLPQNSHHTYLLWHFHSHSKIYCHATSTISFGAIFSFVTWYVLLGASFYFTRICLLFYSNVLHLLLQQKCQV